MALDVLRGAAQGLAGRALKKVAGNIRSGLLGNDRGGSDLSDFAGLNTFGNAFKTKHFTFPIDVESGRETGNHGHYMMFFINQQQPPSLLFNTPQKLFNAADKNLKKAEKQGGGVPQDVMYADGPPIGLTAASKEKFENDKEARYKESLVSRSQTVSVKRRPTTRLDTHIALYMPPTVQVSYNTNYVDTEIGAAANIGAQAFQDYQQGNATADVINKSLKKLGPEMSEGMIKMALGAVDMIPGLQGSQEVIDAQRGFIVAPQMELAFKGIAKRQFQYSFVMMPKSEEEAEQVEKIVQAFKVNMLPTIASGDVRRQTIPNTFNISYMYDGGQNPHLHKISECVLETMSVSYGGDRYKAYEGGRPVVTNMTLNFKELDLISRKDAEEGF
jgi:hypothetical protein|tara:strand:+ start:4908 stop:6068 length:1161 start_codon:yes stop_codon:yes gene_type:complete